MRARITPYIHLSLVMAGLPACLAACGTPNESIAGASFSNSLPPAQTSSPSSSNTSNNSNTPAGTTNNSVASSPAQGTNPPLASPDVTGRSVTMRITDPGTIAILDRSTSDGNDFQVETGGATIAATNDLTVHVVGSLANGGQPPSSDPLQRFGGSNIFLNAAGSQQLETLTISGQVAPLTDTVYGTFINASPTTGTTEITAFSVGNATATMPNIGTAVYTGNFTGFSLPPGGQPTDARGLIGGFTMNADFGAGTVAGQIQPLDAGGPIGTNIDFAANINGSQMTGTASFSAVGSTTTNSSFTGQFNGVNAAEVGGSVSVEGTIPGGTGGPTDATAIIGAIGGVRQ